MRVRSLGQKNPLDKVLATHSRILAWRIPWSEEPGWLQSIRLQRVGHDWSDLAHHSMLNCIGRWNLSKNLLFQKLSHEKNNLKPTITIYIYIRWILCDSLSGSLDFRQVIPEMSAYLQHLKNFFQSLNYTSWDVT